MEKDTTLLSEMTLLSSLCPNGSRAAATTHVRPRWRTPSSDVKRLQQVAFGEEGKETLACWTNAERKTVVLRRDAKRTNEPKEKATLPIRLFNCRAGTQ